MVIHIVEAVVICALLGAGWYLSVKEANSKIKSLEYQIEEQTNKNKDSISYKIYNNLQEEHNLKLIKLTKKCSNDKAKLILQQLKDNDLLYDFLHCDTLSEMNNIINKMK